MCLLLMKYVFDCCVQLLIIMNGERNHSMGNLVDWTPPQLVVLIVVQRVGVSRAQYVCMCPKSISLQL